VLYVLASMFLDQTS